jgi:hypothetical protein
MAWTDQCQLAFKASAERFIAHGEGVRATLRKLAMESGIPYKTLERWYYAHEAKGVPKTEDTATTVRRRARLEVCCPKCGHTWEHESKPRRKGK